MKPKSTTDPREPIRRPNHALHQVREVLGLTQSALAGQLEVSTPYIQAVELGVRAASEDLAWRAAMKTGVWPISIGESWNEAVDFYGEPFDDSAYRRFLSRTVAKWADADAHFASKWVVEMARELEVPNAPVILKALLEIWRCKRFLQHTANEASSPSIGKLTFGELRRDPRLASLVNFKDDPSRPDDETIILRAQEDQAVTIEHLRPKSASPQREWQIDDLVPKSDWPISICPHPADIRAKYLLRAAGVGKTSVLLKKSPRRKQK